MTQQPTILHTVNGQRNVPQGPVASIHGVVRTHPGLQRKDNQDAHAVVESAQFVLFALADGIGSTTGGGTASRIAIRTLRRSLLRHYTIDERVLSACVSKANAAVLDHGTRTQELRGMGTTMVALGFCGTDLFIANVGDSRAYRLRHGQLVPLTHDHTVAFELVRSGLLTPEQGKHNPVSHLLTRALGAADTLEVDCWRSTDGPRRGDRYLLCTDGLHNLVSDDTIREALQGEAAKVAERLIEEANSHGGLDNVTVAVIDIDDDFPVGAGDEHGDKGKQPEIQAIPEIPETLSAASLRGGTVWLKDTPIEGALLEPEGDIPAGTEFHDTSRLIPWLLVIFLTFIGGLGVGMGTWALLSRLSPATQEETTRSNAGHMEPDELGLSGATIRSATEAVEQARLAVTPGIVDKLPGIQELVTYYQQLPDGVQRLRRDAQQVREALDLETRKLALWYSRHEQLKSEDPLELAESVALSSAEVAEKKRAYDMARAAYLKQAEVLVYNPLDTQQEQRVATLQAVHDKNRQELTSAVRAAVDRALSETLSMVMEASLKRDRLQAALSQMEK